MVTRAENELMTRVEGDAPLGRLMREHTWIPFALSENLVAGDGPTLVRLLGENYVAFRAPDGRIGFLDELCPHRRASLTLARAEDNGLRCIYHGWKIDVAGCVVEAPTQVVRPERFCAAVPVEHFPVHETGGIAWVWLGGGETPPFPDLPFNDEHGLTTVMTVSELPCNWLQGLEGGIDSVHAPILHRSVIEAMLAERTESGTEGVRATFAAPPVYETEPASFGLRQASLRSTDDHTYVRVGHYFFPFVVVVPNGYAGATHVFCFAPVDDTHHLVFFGNYGETPLSLRDVSGALQGDLPDPHNFAALQGDRSNRWTQDRDAMRRGHWTGFTHSAIEEDAAVQVSMGPILDRTKEHLSSSDVAVAETRRLILDTLTAYEAGQLPPGSARTPGGVLVPQPFDAMLDNGESWHDLQPAR
jgi:phenylpropionate dioxygenase-like ring-hydroxylating dioxygenase large terminal subunit